MGPESDWDLPLRGQGAGRVGQGILHDVGLTVLPACREMPEHGQALEVSTVGLVVGHHSAEASDPG